MAMQRRPIGRTGLLVPELGFGAAPIGNLFQPVSDGDARATLDAALGESGTEGCETLPE